MFKAAFYETEVTPPLGTSMPGCVAPRGAEDVTDKVYAKAVVISNGRETVATVVLDSVGLPEDCHKFICDRVGEYTPIKSECITVCCNHTHEGAPLTSNYYNGNKEKDYIDVVIRRMADCITLAYKRLQPVKIKYGCGEVYGASYNRDFVMRDGTLAMNTGRDEKPLMDITIDPDFEYVKFSDAQNDPTAEIYNKNCLGNLAGIDPQLPVMSFEAEDGTIIGAMINFACHQTCLSSTSISGDYSSILSKELKKVYGDDFVSLFIIGTAGDINHIDWRISRHEDKNDSWMKHGKMLAKEAIKVIGGAEEVDGDTLISKKEIVKVGIRQITEEDIREVMKNYVSGAVKDYYSVSRAIGYKNTNKRTEENLYVQCTRIGDVYYYALPGEVYVNFGLAIKEKSPTRKTMITELAHAQNGYIPTHEAFLPQSILYEATTGFVSPYEENTGYMLVDKALELAENLKNK